MKLSISYERAVEMILSRPRHLRRHLLQARPRSAYRAPGEASPAEIANEIPPARKLQARLVAATAIVTPVVLIQRLWSKIWKVVLVNLFTAISMMAVWWQFPKIMALLTLSANGIALVVYGCVYGCVSAYCWARNVVDESSA